MDKNIVKTLQREIEANFEHRNTLTEDQFKKYLPLFDPAIKSADLNKLSRDFYRAIDFYRPIKIVDARTSQVLITIPPVLIQTGLGRQEKLTSSELQNVPAHRPDIETKVMNTYTEGLATLFKSADYISRVKEAIDLKEQFSKVTSVDEPSVNQVEPKSDDIWGD